MVNKYYPLKLKLEAMRLVYEEGKIRKEITEALGIRDRDRAVKWLRQYRREGDSASLKKRLGLGRPTKKGNTETYILRLKMDPARAQIIYVDQSLSDWLSFHATTLKSEKPFTTCEACKSITQSSSKRPFS